MGFFATGLFIIFNILNILQYTEFCIFFIYRIWSIFKLVWNILWEMLILKKGTSFFPLLKWPKPTLKLNAWLRENIRVLLNN